MSRKHFKTHYIDVMMDGFEYKGSNEDNALLITRGPDRTVTEVNPSAVIVIKSTVPVGFTAALRERVGNSNILFLRSFFVSLWLCMIIFILLVLWWVLI